jgi:hypothetical protein
MQAEPFQDHDLAFRRGTICSGRAFNNYSLAQHVALLPRFTMVEIAYLAQRTRISIRETL